MQPEREFPAALALIAELDAQVALFRHPEFWSGLSTTPALWTATVTAGSLAVREEGATLEEALVRGAARFQELWGALRLESPQSGAGGDSAPGTAPGAGEYESLPVARLAPENSAFPEEPSLWRAFRWAFSTGRA